MNRRNLIIIALALIFLGGVFLLMENNRINHPENSDNLFETIQLESEDGVVFSADLYFTEDQSAPFIILFHQARYSRGEYREIAPELNRLGFQCMAIDQRSGKAVNNVLNTAKLSAEELGLNTTYPDAYPELQKAIEHVHKYYHPEQLLIWGSSYSAALLFVLANEYPDEINGILAFAPGEYFKINGKSIAQYATSIHCPVFITSARDEFDSWKHIYDSIPHQNKYYYLPEDQGYHGSKALWKDHPGHEMYWVHVKDFLSLF